MRAAPSPVMMGFGVLLTLAGTASATRVVCETTVAVGDGKIIIELWPQSAPIGVKRFQELVQGGFMNGLPMFRAIPNFLIQFGIQPDAALQRKWEAAGNIEDDPRSTIPFTDGVVSYAGYGKNSRGTHLFMTLGNQPGLGKSPWEVPVGKIVGGIDVMHGVYTGYMRTLLACAKSPRACSCADCVRLGAACRYGDKVDQGRLRGHNGKEYLAQFPLLDSFKSCSIEQGDEGGHSVEL